MHLVNVIALFQDIWKEYSYVYERADYCWFGLGRFLASPSRFDAVRDLLNSMEENNREDIEKIKNNIVENLGEDCWKTVYGLCQKHFNEAPKWPHSYPPPA